MDKIAQSAQNNSIVTGLVNTSDAAPIQVPKAQAVEHYKLYCAAGGLDTSDPDNFRKISVQEFADSIGWGRRTLYDWQKSEPNFWDDVNKKRNEVYGGARTQLVWRGVFLRAAKGDAKQAEMFLSHYSDYEMRPKKEENELNSWADLVLNAQKRQQLETPES